MIQAAVSGQGVALGRQPLVSDLIQSGALVAPFRQTSWSDRARISSSDRSSPLESRKCANLPNGWSPRPAATPRSLKLAQMAQTSISLAVHAFGSQREWLAKVRNPIQT
jgi:hypothetical protein